MTPKQQTLYFRRWGSLVASWRALGLKATDSVRKELQRAAIGRDITSKALNNAELDRTLFAFMIAAEPANALAYRTALASDHCRITRSHYVARLLARRLKPATIRDDTAADKYILGTAAQMLGTPKETLRLAQIDEHTYGKICAAFTYSLARAQKKLATQEGITLPTETPKAEEGNRRKGEEEKAQETTWQHPFCDDAPTTTPEPEPAYAGPTENDPF